MTLTDPLHGVCTALLGGRWLYPWCAVPRGIAVYRLDPQTGRTLAAASLPRSSEPPLVYTHGSLYEVSDVAGQHREIERLDGITLARPGTSRQYSLTGQIAATPSGLSVGVAAARARIVRLNPTQLTPIGSVSIPFGQNDDWIAASGKDIYVVVTNRGARAQTVVRLAQPR